MKTDKFRWDFFVKHDFVKINKSLFETEFLKYRS